jgi:hypothetical protein
VQGNAGFESAAICRGLCRRHWAWVTPFNLRKCLEPCFGSALGTHTPTPQSSIWFLFAFVAASGVSRRLREWVTSSDDQWTSHPAPQSSIWELAQGIHALWLYPDWVCMRPLLRSSHHARQKQAVRGKNPSCAIGAGDSACVGEPCSVLHSKFVFCKCKNVWSKLAPPPLKWKGCGLWCGRGKGCFL